MVRLSLLKFSDYILPLDCQPYKIIFLTNGTVPTVQRTVPDACRRRSPPGLHPSLNPTCLSHTVQVLKLGFQLQNLPTVKIKVTPCNLVHRQQCVQVQWRIGGQRVFWNISNSVADDTAKVELPSILIFLEVSQFSVDCPGVPTTFNWDPKNLIFWY